MTDTRQRGDGPPNPHRFFGPAGPQNRPRGVRRWSLPEGSTAHGKHPSITLAPVGRLYSNSCVLIRSLQTGSTLPRVQPKTGDHRAAFAPLACLIRGREGSWERTTFL